MIPIDGDGNILCGGETGVNERSDGERDTTPGERGVDGMCDGDVRNGDGSSRGDVSLDVMRERGSAPYDPDDRSDDEILANVSDIGVEVLSRRDGVDG